MFLVPLSKNQKKLIRQVCGLQLECLGELIRQEDEAFDLTMYALENEITEEHAITLLKANYRQWRRLRKCPHRLMSLDFDNTKILKTLMYRYYERKYPRAVWRVWKKLDALICLEYPRYHPSE